MRPLKKALASPTMHEYFGQVLAQLPACDAKGLEEWKHRATGMRIDEPLPPCSPGDEASLPIAEIITAHADEIPDKTPVFTGGEPHLAFDVTVKVNALLWLVFLVPILLVVLGAALAGRGARGFMRWSAATMLLGGLLAMMISILAGGWLLPLVHSESVHWHLGSDSGIFATEAGRQFTRQVVDSVAYVLDELFSPVLYISIGVCAFGVVLLVFSFLVGREPRQQFT
jgi:hypothetical protein